MSEEQHQGSMLPQLDEFIDNLRSENDFNNKVLILLQGIAMSTSQIAAEVQMIRERLESSNN